MSEKTLEKLEKKIVKLTNQHLKRKDGFRKLRLKNRLLAVADQADALKKLQNEEDQQPS